jgi:hypothetical protein
MELSVFRTPGQDVHKRRPLLGLPAGSSRKDLTCRGVGVLAYQGTCSRACPFFFAFSHDLQSIVVSSASACAWTQSSACRSPSAASLAASSSGAPATRISSRPRRPPANCGAGGSKRRPSDDHRPVPAGADREEPAKEKAVWSIKKPPALSSPAVIGRSIDNLAQSATSLGANSQRYGQS